jgi:FK506-binding nuclear protein
MAALDPTEEPEADDEGNVPAVPRSTLKLVRQRYPDLDDELDDEYLQQMLGGSSDEDDDEVDSDEDDDEPNGGPSDPAKSKKAKQEAALKKLMAAAKEEDSDEDMGDDDAAKPNGVGKANKKGKEPATSSDEEEDEDEEDIEGLDMEDLVICTLDTERVRIPTYHITAFANSDYRTISNPWISQLVLTRKFSSWLPARILSI